MKANRACLLPLFLKNQIKSHGFIKADFINTKLISAGLTFIEAEISEDVSKKKNIVVCDENTTYLRFNLEVVAAAKRYYDQFANEHLPVDDDKRITISNTSFEFIIHQPSGHWFIILNNEKYGSVMTFWIYDVFE